MGGKTNYFSACQHFKVMVMHFNTDVTLKASILLLPPIPIYVIIRHGSKFKPTISLHCGPVINNSMSLSVDFRFCYWYTDLKANKTPIS